MVLSASCLVSTVLLLTTVWMRWESSIETVQRRKEEGDGAEILSNYWRLVPYCCCSAMHKSGTANKTAEFVPEQESCFKDNVQSKQDLLSVINNCNLNLHSLIYCFYYISLVMCEAVWLSWLIHLCKAAWTSGTVLPHCIGQLPTQGGVLGMSNWAETQRQTQDRLEGLYLSAGLRTPQSSPRGTRGGGRREAGLIFSA